MSQNTAINESVIVMRRHDGPKPPTRFINLDRLPADEGEVVDFHRCLADCEEGLIANGWGEGRTVGFRAHRSGRLDACDLALP